MLADAVMNPLLLVLGPTFFMLLGTVATLQWKVAFMAFVNDMAQSLSTDLAAARVSVAMDSPICP